MMLTKDSPVWISKLGGNHGNKQYAAEVAGISVNDVQVHYIVRLLETIDAKYGFDYIAIPESCISPRINST